MELLTRLDFSSSFYGLIVLISILVYSYLTWNYDYWKKQGVPGKKPKLIIGTITPFWMKIVHEQDIEQIQKYGRVCGTFIGRNPALLTSDPDVIKQVTVKDFNIFTNRRSFGTPNKKDPLSNMLTALKDDEWRQVRNTLTPTFTTGKLKQMMSLIEQCVGNSKKILEEPSSARRPIDARDYFQLLTIDVIASVAFGVKIESLDDPENEFRKYAKRAFTNSPYMGYIIVMWPLLFKLVLFSQRNKMSPFRYFLDVANKTIDMRIAQKETAIRDFLQIMLDAQKDEDEDSTADSSDGKLQKKKTLTREVIVGQTVIFLLAGHETTATTLSFMAYSLAMHQDIQEKLIQEVDDVMSRKDGKIDYETIMGMEYLDMVISETLRMYPAATRLDRVCSQDNYKIKNLTLKKGMLVIPAIYALHHDPEFYPNPEVFDPNRFSAENKKARNPATYLPFGSGPRNCIAMRFALMEIKIAMVHLLSEYRFTTCEKTEYPLKMENGVGLLRPVSVHLVFQKRNE